jgi:hypothetical protein
MYWRIRDLWGPTNLVASTVTESDYTPLYFMDDIRIVFGPPHGLPVEVFAWKTALGYGGLGSTL